MWNSTLDAKRTKKLVEGINQFETLIDEYRVEAWERLRALL